MKLPAYYENPSVLHVGTEENRCYFVPFSSFSEAQNVPPERSSRRLNLNGRWRFAYYESPFAVPDGVLRGEAAWDEISVPGVWQQFGYDKHMYSSCRYPIPFDPPYVPHMNPCGVYARTFSLPKADDSRRYMVFEGVDSCIYLYINGAFVGYSQVSHSTSEFDVTEHVLEGENLVVALVLKWCDGTYLETQDKMRMSGIFRDVYVLTRPQRHVRDYRVSTELNACGADVRVALESDCDASLRLFTPGGEEVLCDSDGRSFRVSSPLLWNAEQPNLYTLYIVAPGEVICQRVGIREVRVADGSVLLNGVAIKLRGVNRHDVDPFTGFAITREQAKTDLRIMKEHNINAIRTSHYPNAPWLVQMCDEYGFYLIDEADVESHGCLPIYKGSWEKTFGLIANDQRFDAAILDRVQRCVVRDQNAVCVLFWSLGNESGYGPSFVEAARWVRGYDPSRLLHYECVDRNVNLGLGADTTLVDVRSHMYASPEMLDEYFTCRKDMRPYVLCEYAHAMGNSPGDLEDYWQVINRNEGMAGAFVWEWCDQSVYLGKAANGMDKFSYGGDFDEFPHDGNFCLDGLVTPDRRPSTGLMEYKNVLRPLRASYEGGILTLRDYLDFTDAEAFICASYTLTQNGRELSRGTLPLDGLKAKGSVSMPLPVAVPASGECYFNICYTQKVATALVPAGHQLGFDQLLLLDDRAPMRPLSGDLPVALEQTDARVIVRGAAFEYSFDALSGAFDDMRYRGSALLTRPMQYNIFRAPIDNERLIKDDIFAAGYNRAFSRTLSFEAKLSGGMAEIACDIAIVSPCVQRIMDIRARYTIDGQGAVRVKLDCARNTEMPALPRFGLRFFLASELCGASYFGYGPVESYVDKRRASAKGIYETDAVKNDVAYIRPQENGAHYDCTWLRAHDGDGLGLEFTSDRGFSFNISHFTQEELTEKKHDFELEPINDTVLMVDYMNSGIGSNSCGPKLKEEYQLTAANFTYCLTFAPTQG